MNPLGFHGSVFRRQFTNDSIENLGQVLYTPIEISSEWYWSGEGRTLLDGNLRRIRGYI